MHDQVTHARDEEAGSQHIGHFAQLAVGQAQGRGGIEPAQQIGGQHISQKPERGGILEHVQNCQRQRTQDQGDGDAPGRLAQVRIFDQDTAAAAEEGGIAKAVHGDIEIVITEGNGQVARENDQVTQDQLGQREGRTAQDGPIGAKQVEAYAGEQEVRSGQTQ